jgi:hypothetical protein
MSVRTQRIAAALLAACLAGPAAATVVGSGLTPGLWVSVGARVDNQVADDEQTTSVGTTIYGNARASIFGADAGVEPGASWPLPCANPACLPPLSLTTQTAHGQGEANGALGRLRTHAYASVSDERSAFARGDARIDDVVKFGLFSAAPRLVLHIDGRGRGGARGNAFMDFTVFLGRHDCDTSFFTEGCFAPAFTFHAQEYEGNDLDSWYYGLGDGSDRLAEGSGLPDGGLDIIVPLLEFGQRPGIDIEYDLVTTLGTQAECVAWSEGQSKEVCTSHFDASNTVYVGITGLASSTYRYPGIAATDPGNSAPTPASLPLVLLALGAATFGTARPRRARRS